MPHMSLGGSEDFYSTDEVKVYKDEGNKDEEERSSENLTEEKLGLVTESEGEGKNSSLQGNFASSEKSSSTVSDDDKPSSGPAQSQSLLGSLGFFLPPYGSPYTNGSSMAGKFSLVQPPYPGLVMYNEFAQPPPAHKGYSPVYHDPKSGLPRPPVYAAYPAPPGQYPHPLYSPEFTGAAWHKPNYPLSQGAFAGSFPPSLSSLSRYGPPGLLSHPGLGHPGIPHPASLGPGPKSELMTQQLIQDSHRQLNSSHGDENSSCKSSQHHHQHNSEDTRKKPYVKKPLNAFMLFMKEMRPKVITECTLKESAAINQILGSRWHALDRSEQAKYYEMARKEKELHLQLYPGWSARDNYAAHQKKKKRKKDGDGGGSMAGMGSSGSGMSPDSPMSGHSAIGGSAHQWAMSVDSENKPGECPNEKKCRARYGMEQQSRWCKPCRRKKKCIRYKHDSDEDEGEKGDDSLLRNHSMDSSLLSGCESDSSNCMSSPAPTTDGWQSQQSSSSTREVDSQQSSSSTREVDSQQSSSSTREVDSQQNSSVAHETSEMNSQFSLIKVEAVKNEVPKPRLFRPTTSRGASSPLPTYSPLPQMRRLTPHSVESFLFHPPPLYMPYHLPPPPPLALPMSFFEFPPYESQSHSPRTQVRQDRPASTPEIGLDKN